MSSTDQINSTDLREDVQKRLYLCWREAPAVVLVTFYGTTCNSLVLLSYVANIFVAWGEGITSVFLHLQSESHARSSAFICYVTWLFSNSNYPCISCQLMWWIPAQHTLTHACRTSGSYATVSDETVLYLMISSCRARFIRMQRIRCWSSWSIHICITVSFFRRRLTCVY